MDVYLTVHNFMH